MSQNISSLSNIMYRFYHFYHRREILIASIHFARKRLGACLIEKHYVWGNNVPRVYYTMRDMCKNVVNSIWLCDR